MQMKRLIAAGLAFPMAALVSSSTFDVAPASGPPLAEAAVNAPVTATTTPQPTEYGAATRNTPVALRSATPTVDLPPAALAAYQRAAAVINTSAPDCRLPWQLLAAVGQVETDHGRRLPAPVRALADSDGGQYDSDANGDHPVGPLQILPSAWSQVAVDADGDGSRDPSNLDDAALGLAVRLCVGDDDLSTAAGQRAALARHNADPGYLDLVVQLTVAYTQASTPIAAFATPTELAAPTAVRVPKSTRPGRGKAADGAKAAKKGKGKAEFEAAKPAPAEPAPTSPPKPTTPPPTDPVEPGGPTDPGEELPTCEVPEEPTTGPTPTEPAPTEPAPTDPAPSTDPTTDPTEGDPEECAPAKTDDEPGQDEPTETPTATPTEAATKP